MPGEPEEAWAKEETVDATRVEALEQEAFVSAPNAGQKSRINKA